MLKILTLNLWHDMGPWPERAQLIRAWLDELDPDLIGFQEVLRGPTIDPLRELCEGRYEHLAYFEAMDFWVGRGVTFGNAVASRWPLLATHPLQLPDGGDGERRSAISVRVDAPGGEISFTTTHLNWKLHHSNVRLRQSAALAQHVREHSKGLDHPPILVGDFNAVPESDEIRFLSGLASFEDRSAYFADAWQLAGDGSPGATFCAANPYARTALEPDRRLDYVFVGPPTLGAVGRIEACRRVCDRGEGVGALAEVWPSDHFGVYCELRDEPDPSLWHVDRGSATPGR